MTVRSLVPSAHRAVKTPATGERLCPPSRCATIPLQRGRGDGGSMVTIAGVDNKDPEALVEEEQRMRQLRMLVTVTTAVIQNRPLSRREAEQAVEELRKQAMKLFPDKGEVFDLIYRPRFHRLIDQRFSA